MKRKLIYTILIGGVILFLLSRLDFGVGPDPTLSGRTDVVKIPLPTLVYENLAHFFYTSLIIGLCLFLGLISFFQGMYSKSKDYKLWSLYLFSNALFFFAGLDYNFRMNIITGALQLEWYPIRRPWAIPAQYIVVISYLSFVMSFLKLRSYDLPLYKMVSWLQVFLGITATASFWSVQNYRYTFYFDAFIFFIVTALFGIFIRISNKDIPQKGLLMIGSIGVLITGTIATIIDQFNLMTAHPVLFPTFHPFNIYSVGVIFELIFFSLALSQRTIQIQIENQELQKKYSEELEEEIEARTREIEEKTKQLEEERLNKITSDFELKIAEVEMSALRSQMNPHFIFNCLNSIKLYTMQNDSITASDYLTKFSRLIRLVLENSRAERITLEQEIETLELYIEMEKMRFKGKIQSHIQVDKRLDTGFIEIPPLLLQPFVENAIWHGLVHKEEGGILQINITSPNDDHLKVEIIDNGIGRQQSAELKSKSATSRKSFGMKVTNERIELINHLYNSETLLTITDLYDKAGRPAGTRVTLQIHV